MRNALLRLDSCWGERAMPVALPRDGRIYGLLAEVLDEYAPRTWRGVRARLVVDADGGRDCFVASSCGAVEEADQKCLEAFHEVVMALGSKCIAPRSTHWMGIFVEHEFQEGRMRVQLMHGGLDESDLEHRLSVMKERSNRTA